MKIGRLSYTFELEIGKSKRKSPWVGCVWFVCRAPPDRKYVREQGGMVSIAKNYARKIEHSLKLTANKLPKTLLGAINATCRSFVSQP